MTMQPESPLLAAIVVVEEQQQKRILQAMITFSVIAMNAHVTVTFPLSTGAHNPCIQTQHPHVVNFGILDLVLLL